MFQRLLIIIALVSLSTAVSAEETLTLDGKLAAGHSLYLSASYQEALSLYEEAKDMNSGNALTYYFLGCTKAKLKNYNEAISALNTAASIAGEKDLGIHAKSLFMIAVLEENRASLSDAKAAWTNYISFAKKHSNATTFVTNAEERIQKIEAMEKISKEYAPVKAKAPVEKTDDTQATDKTTENSN